MNKFLYIISLAFTSVAAVAQVNVNGIVKDAKGEPMIGIRVSEVGDTRNSCLTDEKGEFSLSLDDDAFIELNYARPITVEDIAAFCDLNRNYLGRIFKDAMNQTLQHFLMYYRMNRAAELLRFSDLTVNEIGKQCGYPNQLHFSRAFKNIFGISPNHWREKNRNRADG